MTASDPAAIAHANAVRIWGDAAYVCAKCDTVTDRDEAPSPCETHDVCADCVPCDDQCREVQEIDAAEERYIRDRREAAS